MVASDRGLICLAACTLYVAEPLLARIDICQVIDIWKYRVGIINICRIDSYLELQYIFASYHMLNYRVLSNGTVYFGLGLNSKK